MPNSFGVLLPEPRRAHHKIRLVFGPHDARDRFAPKALSAGKAEHLVMEKARGVLSGARVPASLGIEYFEGKSFFDRDSMRFVRKLMKKGGRMYAGESFVSREEQLKLRKISSQRGTAWNAFALSPSFKNCMRYLALATKENLFRERLVLRSIRELSKTSESIARYGSMHSLLSLMLQKEGIASKKVMRTTAFLPEEVFQRKATLGKKLSLAERRAAYLQIIFTEAIGNSREFNYLNSHEKGFFIAELFKRLSAKNNGQKMENISVLANSIAKQGSSAFSFVRGKEQKTAYDYVLESVLKANGLKKNCAKREILQWLQDKSAAYRHYNNRAKHQ